MMDEIQILWATAEQEFYVKPQVHDTEKALGRAQKHAA
jgi:hypothetical protein